MPPRAEHRRSSREILSQPRGDIEDEADMWPDEESDVDPTYVPEEDEDEDSDEDSDEDDGGSDSEEDEDDDDIGSEEDEEEDF
jgi:hypothetical protein